MTVRRPYATRMAATLRGHAQRGMFLLLIVTALFLIAFSRTQPGVAEMARARVADAFSPILAVLSQPAAAVASVVEYGHQVSVVFEENAKLRAELAALRNLKAVAGQIAAENESLRRLLNFKAPPPVSQISARVIADAGGGFVRTKLVNVGTLHGVLRDQAAVTGDGLIGRVVEVGARSARILLVTDLNSRIPVLIEGSRDRAVLSGDNNDNPRLAHLPPGTMVEVGSRIVTSGDGGLFPPGLPIGVVQSVDHGVARVRPFAPLDRLDYVRLLEYSPKIPADAQVRAETRPLAAAEIPGP